MSYRDLDIWRLAREAVIAVHAMTLRDLPKFEMYEEGSQIRRSIKSVKSNIVEGYGRRRYKQEYIHFLTYAHASCDETIDHLETLLDTGSLTNQDKFNAINIQLDELGRKINKFIQSVIEHHNTFREASGEYSYEKESDLA
ncbi:MAG TPA: four helix bundle protein [Kiritimatiellia bacterium]|nr:four helix bundle protein [Kiritimatiellia bacterium]